ncbi:hypothetical protein COSHB9_09400 [Companilactobacillus alimentarius]|uniref:Uncharacterized protein n=1 Tax=Companilactobacillus alimentarius DSM 20249 TaxID=1423720 RepID=A0A2K9HIW5_9LACO|nr:hypothetical protein LA20249_09990 [Companilactobacillus alimentarius DSM 20249]GEO45022.1 hypothetical protein LAL01_12540 [Companilactobacillus alimentarius]
MTLKEVRVSNVERDNFIRSMEESVGSFNLGCEGSLINLVFKHLKLLEYDDSLEDELGKFRHDLIKYDIDTGHRHNRDVEELLFKIKNRNLPYI